MIVRSILAALVVLLAACGGGDAQRGGATSGPPPASASVEAPGWLFLDERLTDAPSMDLLRSQN